MEEINFHQLKRLWNLKITVETGSIKKAAIRANVTSSAISQSISGLEESLGRKVLLRKKDQLIPTEYGAQLLASASSAFNACFDLQQNMSTTCIAKPKMDWLDLAMTESIAVEILPNVMQRLREKFPNLRLKVKTGRSSALTTQVRKGELCMAIVEENDQIEGARPKIQVAALTTERLALYVSSREGIQALGESALDKLGLAVLSAGPDGHPHFIARYLRALGRASKPVLTSDSYEILRSAAVAGSAVALLPERVAKRQMGELTELHLSSLTEKQIESSNHKIYLVSEPSCAPEEHLYLAQELTSVIRGKY